MSRLEKEALAFLTALSELAGDRAGASVATSAIVAWRGFNETTALRVIEDLAGDGLITGNTSRVALTAVGANLVRALARSMERLSRLLIAMPLTTGGLHSDCGARQARRDDRPVDFA